MQGDYKARGEAGFTLVETLIAIVILIFGLIAVANLFVVATSSNVVANQGTAATSVASDQMDTLKASDFTVLSGLVGGNLSADVGPTLNPCSSYSATVDGASYNCDTAIPGVGNIHTRWQITATPLAQVLFITVRSEGTGALVGARSRAEFTSFRSCTDPGLGCPAP